MTTNGHPTTEVMVKDAIRELNERKGASSRAIKSKMAATYADMDMVKMNSHINKFLHGAVRKGLLIQTSGTGANGRFKLNKDAKEKKKPSAAKATTKVAKKTTTTAKSPKKTAGAKKKTTTAKKTMTKKTADGAEKKKASAKKK